MLLIAVLLASSLGFVGDIPGKIVNKGVAIDDLGFQPTGGVIAHKGFYLDTRTVQHVVQQTTTYIVDTATERLRMETTSFQRNPASLPVGADVPLQHLPFGKETRFRMRTIDPREKPLEKDGWKTAPAKLNVVEVYVAIVERRPLAQAIAEDQADADAQVAAAMAQSKKNQAEDTARAASEQPVANLFVSSDPVAAEIEVDGKLVGMTPSRLELPAGSYGAVVKKSGFKLWERKVTLMGGGDITLSAELTAEPNR